MKVRDEETTDHGAVHAVNAAAFETASEADLVDRLRDRPIERISLVAERDDEIVGHIFFSPVTLEGYEGSPLMGLGPMAVRPDCQRSGVGSALVRKGLERCRELPAAAVVVLGHPAYYRRFGFLPSVRFGIRCVYEVPEDVFMVLELEPGSLHGFGGTVHYDPEFQAVDEGGSA